MARIPDAELERLKHDISLERLATARGIVLKPSGKNLMGLCPFHDDHEPSLSINPAQNLWHCFGCQQGGTRSRVPGAGVNDALGKSMGINSWGLGMSQYAGMSSFSRNASNAATSPISGEYRRFPFGPAPLPTARWFRHADCKHESEHREQSTLARQPGSLPQSPTSRRSVRLRLSH
jgi:hypothetical protein